MNVGAGDARCSAATIDTNILLMKIENLKERNMAHTTIADITVDDLKKLIRESVGAGFKPACQDVLILLEMYIAHIFCPLLKTSR